MLFAVIVVASSSLLASRQEAALPKLRAGKELHVPLPAGKPEASRRRFTVELPIYGRIAVTARCQDCDVALGDERALLDLDLGGGFDERLDLDAFAATPVTLVVTSTVPLAAEVDVVVAMESGDPPAEPSEVSTQVAWFERFLEHHGAASEQKVRRTLVELAVDCQFANDANAREQTIHLLELARGEEGMRGCQALRAFALAPADSEAAWKALLLRPEELLDGTDVVALVGLSDWRAKASDAKSAVDLLKRAKASADRGDSRKMQLFATAQLGEALQRSGDAGAAAGCFAAVRSLSRDLDGPAVGASLLRAARFKREARELTDARTFYEAAEKLRRTTALQRLDLCDQLCVLDLMEGRHESAVARLRAVEVLCNATVHVDTLANILTDLAHYNELLGRSSAAQAIVDRLLLVLRAGSGPTLARVYHVDALLLEERGELSRAEHRLDQALNEYGDANVFDEDRLYCRLDRARLLHETGKLDLAQRELDELLAIAREKKLKTHELGAWQGLAEVAMARGDLPTAKRDIAKSVAGFSASGDWDFLLQSLPIQAEIALRLEEYDEARAVLVRADDLLGRADVLGGRPSAAIRSRFVEWGLFAQDLAIELVNVADESERPRAIAWGLEQADHWRARALLSAVSGRSLDAATPPEQLLKGVRKRLRSGQLLVEFATSSRRVYAYVVDRDALDVVDLGTREELEIPVAAFCDEVIRNPRTDAPNDVASRGNALYCQLLKPVLGRASESTQSVVVVPDELVEALPFEALVVEPAATFDKMRFVLDGYSVTYAPSAAVMVALASRAENRPRHRALLVADPDFGMSVADALRRGPGSFEQPLPPLPKSRDEVFAIAGLLIPSDANGGQKLRDRLDAGAATTNRDRHLDEGPFEVLLGAEANVDWFARHDLGQFDLIHFATHTCSDPTEPARSGLALSPGRGGRRVLDLDAIDRFELKADLVVLSACSTAQGPIVKGEGVQSLARAFLERGARGVIATLTSVPDGEALELMKAFYGQWLASPERSAPAALAAAQRAIRGNGALRGTGRGGASASAPLRSAHPSCWAQFVFIGDAQ